MILERTLIYSPYTAYSIYFRMGIYMHTRSCRFLSSTIEGGFLGPRPALFTAEPVPGTSPRPGGSAEESWPHGDVSTN